MTASTEEDSWPTLPPQAPPSTPSTPLPAKAEGSTTLSANAEGVRDRVVVVTYALTQFRIRLEEKFQKRPLSDTIVAPFVKAFNKKSKNNKTKQYKERLAIEKLERLEIEGVVVDDLSAAADVWLPRDGMQATLFFPPPAPPRASPKSALEVPAEGPYVELVKRVKMSVDDICTLEDLAWSSKNLRPQDIEAFTTLAKERGPLNVVNIYAYDNWIDDESLESLCKCFPLMPKLESLYLHNNEITARGCEAIAQYPPVGKLTNLSLWRNQIDGKGFDALGGAIRKGTLQLTMLVIHYNKACIPAKDRLTDECDAKGVTLSM